MSHLDYQNILWLPKVADGIDVKKPIPGEICGDLWKGDNKGSYPFNLCQNPKSNWSICIAILAAPILPLKRAIDSILGSKMVQLGLVMQDWWEPKAKPLIHFVNLSVKLEKKLKHLCTDLRANLLIKLLRNTLLKRVLSGNQVRHIFQSKNERPSALTIL